jgi:hypothetical protein
MRGVWLEQLWALMWPAFLSTHKVSLSWESGASLEPFREISKFRERAIPFLSKGSICLTFDYDVISSGIHLTHGRQCFFLKVSIAPCRLFSLFLTKETLWYLRIHDCPITSVTLVLWTQSQDKGIGTGIQVIGQVTCLIPCCNQSLL